MLHMRQYNAFEAADVKFLVDKQVEFTTIQITETGLRKSILDATTPVRAYLRENNIHDYEQQLQGELCQRYISTYIHTETQRFSTRTSLYRPVTKNGDPRMWIAKVQGVDFLHADDIFAIIAHNGVLHAINLTTTDIPAVCRSHISTPLQDLVSEISESKNNVSMELLGLIRERMSEWTPTDRFADTGVGRTVESLLGIKMNSDTTPDYKGIELKSHRQEARVRNTLFTQTPEWEISRLKSGKAIVDKYGYTPEGYPHKTLHVTLSANRPNQQGLRLNVEAQRGILEANEYMLAPQADGSYRKVVDVAAWRLMKLHERLLSKHRETFWIDAETKK